MNENIRNEIREEELENVNGGFGKLLNQEPSSMKVCPECGGMMICPDVVKGVLGSVSYTCTACGKIERV